MDESGQVNTSDQGGDNLPPAVQAIPSASPVKGNGDLPEVAMPSMPEGGTAPIIPNAPVPAPGAPAPGPAPMPMPMPPMPPASDSGPAPVPEPERAPIQMPSSPAPTPAPRPAPIAPMPSAPSPAAPVPSFSMPKPMNQISNSDVRIESLLEECVRTKASDLHIQVGLPPILRIDGALQPVSGYGDIDEATAERLIFSTLEEDQKQILIKDKEFDYSFSFGDLGRFRVNAFHEKGNLAGAFRLIPNEVQSIGELGMPTIVSSFADFPRGLVLVTGPTGSGKSTTLAALVDKINREKTAHIITIEDPIEFTHKSIRSVVVQREVHYDTYSFSAALRSALREDPDVVLIGEMRDLETISAAITIAETGHLVFATLHTNSASQSIDRMIDVFPPHQQPQVRSQLSNILQAICAQRLVPAIGGGRVVAAEILIANPAVRSVIREGKTHQLDTIIQTGADQGMQTMDRTLVKLIQTGVITYDTAKEFAVDMQEFERLARG